MATTPVQRQFHPAPVIGHSDHWYKSHIEHAEAAGDPLARCAFKVGQYITLGVDPHRSWGEKSKYFHHSLKHHCVAGSDATPDEIIFRQKLRDFVTRCAGQEASSMALKANSDFKMRLEMGTSRDVLAEEADEMYLVLLGSSGSRPDFFTPEVFEEIRSLRDRWV
jgi:ferredoxin-NADP reductase